MLRTGNCAGLGVDDLKNDVYNSMMYDNAWIGCDDSHSREEQPT
jgi:hypothetical protein